MSPPRPANAATATAPTATAPTATAATATAATATAATATAPSATAASATAARATAATVALAAAVVAVLVLPAVAAATGWTRPQAVQPGVNPVLSFSPTGEAAIASETRSHGADINLATNGVSFAKSPYTLDPPGQGQTVSSLALSSLGYLAAGFTDPHGAAPVLVRVAPPAPSTFGSAQQLISAGTAQSGQSSPDTLSLLATTDGEIVGAGADDAGGLYTASLTARATSFRVARGPRALAATDDYALTGDAAGNTILAGDGADGCTAVAYRPAHQRFAQTYRTSDCNTTAPNVFDAIAAAGNGQAAMLTEDVSESGAEPNRLLVQVGHDGHFGTAIRLGGMLGDARVGLAAAGDGQITAEWTGCEPGPIVDGRLSETDCAIDAATGTLRGGFTQLGAAGTTLVGAGTGSLGALTTAGAVAVSRCEASRCQFSVFTALATGGFRAAHGLGRGRQLIALSGDGRGDLLAVWTDASGQLCAATGSVASGTWSQTHRLSSGAIAPTTVTARYGPRGKAIVAWSASQKTYAATFSL